MTDDEADKALADVLGAIERNPGTLGSLLMQTLANVLAATRRELAEVKAIVGTVEPPPTVGDVGRAVMAAVTGARVLDQPPDPRPLLRPGARWVPACDDCGNSRWLPIGKRRCLKCEERAVLKAALREALDRWEGWNDQEHTGTKHHAPEAARIAELRRLVDG